MLACWMGAYLVECTMGQLKIFVSHSHKHDDFTNAWTAMSNTILLLPHPYHCMSAVRLKMRLVMDLAPTPCLHCVCTAGPLPGLGTYALLPRKRWSRSMSRSGWSSLTAERIHTPDSCHILRGEGSEN
jgi:hypothetical protein